jgi:hypothetical protein
MTYLLKCFRKYLVGSLDKKNSFRKDFTPLCTANILTMEKIETSLTVTEVNMDTFLDVVGRAVVGLKFS